MSCRIRTSVTDTLLAKDLAKDVNGQLRTTDPMAVEAELIAMSQQIEEEFGVQGLPFTVEEDLIVMNEPYLKHIDSLQGYTTESPESEKLYNDLYASTNRILNEWGISRTQVEQLRDRDGNPIEGVAVSDLVNKAISYLEGNESELPEEAIHFYVAALKHRGEALYQSMAERVHLEPEYQEVITEYAGVEGYDGDSLIDEAIAKVILNRAKAQTQVKDGVAELFESNPELANIGTKEQYSQYLDTIFPDSPNKKILYHIGGKNIQKFDKSMFGKGEGTNASGLGVYFQENPYEIMQGGIGTDYFYESPTPIKSMIEDGVLTLAIANIKPEDNYNPNLEVPQEIVVRDVDRIHILGSKQDIEGFKRFVSKDKEVKYADRNTRWWTRVLNRLREIFDITDPFTKAATDLFRGDISKYKEHVSALTDGTLYRSMGTSQDVIRKRHGELSLKEFSKTEVLDKVTDWEFEVLSDGSTIWRYQLPDGKILRHRASDNSSLNFARAMSEMNRKRYRESPRSIRAQDAGTRLHALANDLAMGLAKEKFAGKINVIDVNGVEIDSVKAARDKHDFPEAVKDELQTRVLKMLTDITKDRKEPLDMYNELKVYNEKEDTAGTIDVLFVDSEGFGHIRDYKFLSTVYSDREKKGAGWVMLKDKLSGSKLLGNSEQIAFYVKTLSTPAYGIRVKTSRLIPGHLVLDNTKDGKEKPIELYMDGSIDKYLREIPVADERSDEASIQGIQQELQKRLAELREKSKLTSKDRSEMVVIQESLRGLSSMEHFDVTIDMIRGMIAKVDGDMDSMSFSERQEALELFEMFKALVGVVGNMSIISKVDGDTKKLEKQIKDLTSALIGPREKLISSLEEDQAKDAHERFGVHVEEMAERSGFMSRFKNLFDFRNPLMRYAGQLIGLAKSNVSKKMLKVNFDWDALHEELKAYAASNGTDLSEVYKKLFRRGKTGYELVHRHKRELFEERDRMLLDTESDAGKRKAILWMKEKYELREDAKERFEAKRKQYFDFIERTYAGDDKTIEHSKKNWHLEHDVFSKDEAWISGKAYGYIKLKPEVEMANMNPDYALILADPVLLKYHTAWYDHMTELMKLVDEAGFDGNGYFVPRILQSAIEAIGKWDSHWGEVAMGDIYRGLTIDTEIGEQSGNVIKRIPLRYVQTPFNRKGEIDLDLLSTDMSRAMIKFSEAAYDYNEKSKIEAQLDFIRWRLANEGPSGQRYIQRDQSGNALISASGEAQSGTKVDNETLALFDTLMALQMYGARDIKGNPLTNGIITRLMSLQALSLMTFPLKAAVATGIGASIFRLAKTGEDNHVTSESISKANKLFRENRQRYLELGRMFNIHQESITDLTEQRMRSSKLHRYLIKKNAFQPLIAADELSDRKLIVEMLHNLTLDAKGNVEMLSKVLETDPEAKSLAETLEYKDGEVKISGVPITDLQYDNIRRRFHIESGGTKGDSSMARAYQGTIEMRMVAAFKNWAPAMVMDRFGDVDYDQVSKRLKEGRYRGTYSTKKNAALKHMKALFSSKENAEENLGFMVLVEKTLNSVARGAEHLILMRQYTLTEQEKQAKIAAGKWSERDEKLFKRRRAAYETELRTLQLNSVSKEVQEMSLESFLKMRQGSIRSTMLEARAVMILLLMMALMSLEGDDDEEFFKQNYATRKAHDLISRIILETAVFMSPAELLKLDRGLVPLLGMAKTLGGIVTNGLDVTRDMIETGSFKDKGDDTGLLWYTGSLVPGVRAYRYWFGDIAKENSSSD